MKKYILVLDLDETLLHTNSNGKTLPRPGLKKFIEELSNIMYIVLYTAALKSYADNLLKKYGIYEFFDGKLYRNSCVVINNQYTKDLNIVAKKLIYNKIHKKNNIPKSLLINNNKITLNYMIFIDNLAENCFLQPKNSIVIKDYIGQTNDKALENINKFLKNLYRFSNKNIKPYLNKNLHQIDTFTKKHNIFKNE
jgi:TFIIF-interacting CTD phosphatase-like protein